MYKCGGSATQSILVILSCAANTSTGMTVIGFISVTFFGGKLLCLSFVTIYLEISAVHIFHGSTLCQDFRVLNSS